MNELELPNLLKGRWEHAIIFTYSLDVPFFENALWSQFAPDCRNKIILVDGLSYQEECARCAHRDLVRYINQRYVVDGIFGPRTAHAKIILLTNSENGRLLVGSGNLTIPGYSSGGEIFTQYDYSANSPQALAAFISIKQLLEDLASNDYVGLTAKRHIQHFLDSTPWIFRAPINDWWPVRHNLNASFLLQLQQFIENQPIEELWVLSPFYDEKAIALEQILNTLQPLNVILLMQAGHTSANALSLQKVLDRFTGRWRIHPFSKYTDNTYIHAKSYILKMHNSAVCLQGSPNLSQVALLFTPPNGNIEVANLLKGPRNAFDSLIDALNIKAEITDLAELNLSYETRDMATDPALTAWSLSGGEWYRDRLWLRYQGDLPDLEGALLIIGTHSVPIKLSNKGVREIETILTADTVQLLEQTVPVTVQWCEGKNVLTSNPVFICNRRALDEMLKVSSRSEILHYLGNPDINDDEIESLFQQLEAVLLIDQRSLWEITGRPASARYDDEDEDTYLAYEDVDYDTLRQHPRLQQYLLVNTGIRDHDCSRLNIILDSITMHFDRVLGNSAGAQRNIDPSVMVEDQEFNTEEEAEQQEEEIRITLRTSEQRVRNLLQRFVNRYIRGMCSSNFQDLVPPAVIVQNYGIFSHIIWRLFCKDWVDDEFMMRSLLNIWGFYWGNIKQRGYLRALSEEEKSWALEWIRQYHVDAELLAALHYGAYTTRVDPKSHGDIRFELRDLWCAMLRDFPFPIKEEILEETWLIVADHIPYEPPNLISIMDELTNLANFNTRDSFLRSLEQLYDYPFGVCTFEKHVVYREPLEEEVSVDCLIVRADDVRFNQEKILEILREWRRFETLDYYRIHAPARDRRFYYETLKPEALYWGKGQELESIPLDLINLPPTEANNTLSRMQTIAAALTSSQ